MTRVTIDYGIDLGTTNSVIARINGTSTDVIRNQEGGQFTPSAVMVNKVGHITVGRKARERYEADPANCAIEFKQFMGMGEPGKKTFEASGKSMLPEELSAEVLKSLRTDVQLNHDERIRSIVITVPADFKTPHNDATNKAANLAGFEEVHLLQEPVAAALAYGFQEADEDAYWLVYDFGGGTFDAAIVQIQDGVISVVNHAGDNELGGKLIDWDIVTKKLIPVVTGRHRLQDFRRGNPRWRDAMAQMKLAAEEAKIEVCRTDAPATIYVEKLCKDETGESIDLECELTPADLQEIVAPYSERALNRCRRALNEKGLEVHNIQKILMVGGSSLIPWLRTHVQTELGRPLEHRLDPMTVVSQGAAIFAGGKRITIQEDDELPAGACRVDLKYDPTGIDTDPMVGGKVVHPQGKSVKGFALELTEKKSEWSSGRVVLPDDGVFMIEIHAEEGRRNQYTIDLSDKKGNRVECTPTAFPYTVAVETPTAPLTNSIGVAMANNRVDIFFTKGSPLPNRKRITHRTAVKLTQGDSNSVLRIPIVEGEHIDKADRNRRIGQVLIPGKSVRRDVPTGQEIEITLKMDESRIPSGEAYIPYLEQGFPLTSFEMEVESVNELRKSLEREETRLREAREKAEEQNDERSLTALQKIDEEETVDQVRRLLEAAEDDAGARNACENRLLNLRSAIDDVEDSLRWPQLVKAAKDQLDNTREVVNKYGKAEDKRQLQMLERELQSAQAAGDADLVQKKTDALSTLNLIVLREQPGWWAGCLQYLEENRVADMRDPSRARELIQKGRQAWNRDEFEELKSSVRGLWDLLPDDDPDRNRGGHGGGTIN